MFYIHFYNSYVSQSVLLLKRNRNKFRMNEKKHNKVNILHILLDIIYG